MVECSTTVQQPHVRSPTLSDPDEPLLAASPYSATALPEFASRGVPDPCQNRPGQAVASGESRTRSVPHEQHSSRSRAVVKRSPKQ